MVAQVACIHAQGFGINFVPLHHIVAKAPCIARGTMLKPGSSPGFFSFGCTRIFLFLDIKKRPKLLKFGRFVYIFVYVLRKTLIFKVYCGETGTYCRSRSGCYFCFFQQKIEWIWLYEQHPELYKKAMEFEKDGYTWNQGESLADMIKPERIRKIKLDIIKRQEENRAKQKGTTLVELFDDEVMCTNCFI